MRIIFYALLLSSAAGMTRQLDYISIGSATRQLDSVDSDDGAPNKRECELESPDDANDKQSIKFKCKAKVDDGETEIKDKIKYKVSLDSNSIEVEVEYEQEIEAADETETETETKYKITFDEVIEYKKPTATTNGNSAYDPETDSIVQRYPLGNMGSFSPVVNDASGVTSTFEVMSTDNVVLFKFTITRAETGKLTANKMKIDFGLTNFDWQDAGSYVALVSTIESKRELEIERPGEGKEKVEDVVISFADALEATDGAAQPFGEYTWDKEALVTHNVTNATTPIEVVATSAALADDSGETIYFSFIGSEASGASDIYWDPEAGIGYAAASASSMRCASTLVFLGLVSLVALW